MGRGTAAAPRRRACRHRVPGGDERFVSSETTRGWSARGSATTRLRSWSRCTSSASCSSAQGVGVPGAVAFTVGEEGLGNLRGVHGGLRRARAGRGRRGRGPRPRARDRRCGREPPRPRARHRARRPLVGRSRAAERDPRAARRSGRRLRANPRADVPVNVGLVSGGRSVNTIAGEAELAVEARALDERALERFARTARAPCEVSIRRFGSRRDDGQTAGGTARPGIAAPRDRPGGCGRSSGFPRRSARARPTRTRRSPPGIPALTLGVANGEGMHTLEERIDAGSLELGVAQLRCAGRRAASSTLDPRAHGEDTLAPSVSDISSAGRGDGDGNGSARRGHRLPLGAARAPDRW